MRTMLAGGLALMVGGCCGVGGLLGIGSLLVFGSALQPPSVVPYVDLTRYVGFWYEIARYPTPFQANCASSTADYTARPDGTIGVLNTCLAADGSVVSTIEGSASVVDPTTNAKLVVTFPGVPFPGDYWIIDLGQDYEYAVVGDPTRLTLFILSRTPTLDQATLDAILSRLPDQGYDPAKLVYDTPVTVQ
jgi:apolipoprotein D and lipocalin family protein